MTPAMRRVRMLVGIFLSLLASIPSASAQTVNSRAFPCPNDPTITGYTTIADINQDQFDELARITAGSAVASPPYSFVLCPNTQFDASAQSLNIVLSGTVLSCGSDMTASSTMGCSIQGGSPQVYLADSTTPNYQFTSATIIGVTFEMFNGTAIDVMATETLTLTLMDVVWKNFFSDFVVRQQAPMEGVFPARVDVVKGLIDNGMGGSLFSNDGGVLVLDQLTVANITSAGLVSTSNQGVVMIQSATVSRSVIDTVASAMMGSTLSIMDVDVFDMVFTKTIFQVSNAGSMLLLNRTKIRDINNEGLWKGVAVDDSADAKLEQVQFTKNGQFESIVDARNAATVELVDCVFEGNVGLSPNTVSNVVYAILSSTVNMSRTKFTGNTQITALALASMQAVLSIQQSCFMGGSSEEVVLRSSDSAVTISENYVSMNVNSTTCPGGNVRMTVEQPGSQCYQFGGTSCNSICDILADQASCVADMVLLAPGMNITMVPNGTMTMPPAINTTVAPTANDNTTIPPEMGGNETIPPTGTETIMPTEAPSLTGDSVTRIDVGFEVWNDMMITSPEEVNASGIGDAFPVYVEELVTNLTNVARRQLIEHQRRRLEITLVPGSAVVYDIISVSCVMENRTSNMTADQSCHEAMGTYELMLSSDEDPVAVRSSYTRETRKGIDDGTLQEVLLEVEPNSPLIVGPSIDLRSPGTGPPPAPTPSQPAGPPSSLMPTCSSKRGKSKSKSKSRAKGSRGGSGSKAANRGMKMMRKHRRAIMPAIQNGETRRLEGHGLVIEGDDHEIDVDEGEETSHFENTQKDHDEGDYYSMSGHEAEEILSEEDGEGIADDECEEPSSKGKKSSKGSAGTVSHRRQLLEGRPRIHGAHHNSHRISDMRAVLEEELEAS